MLAARFNSITKDDTELAVNTLLRALQAAMAARVHIEIRGFGSFSVTPRAPRMGRNPRTGEGVAIPGRSEIRFKPGKALREAVEKTSA